MIDSAEGLLNWALDHQCIFKELTIASHPSYNGYGLFNTAFSAATDNDSKRTALFVPNKLIISIDLISEAADESEELADILNALPELPNLEPIIAIFLLYQVYLKRVKRHSQWSSYIEHLPKSSLLPILWNNQEIDFLAQTAVSISHAVLAKLSYLKSIYEGLQRLPGWFQSISWYDFLLGVSWVSSRTIECPRTKTPLLVPILDMANHTSARTAAWEITDVGIELRREPTEIAAREELTISYDLDRGTGERLYRYGFIEDTGTDVVSTEFTLLDPSPPRIRGGNLFRISLVSLRDSFRDLSFLAYENWYFRLFANF